VTKEQAWHKYNPYKSNVDCMSERVSFYAGFDAGHDSREYNINEIREILKSLNGKITALQAAAEEAVLFMKENLQDDAQQCIMLDEALKALEEVDQ